MKLANLKEEVTIPLGFLVSDPDENIHKKVCEFYGKSSLEDLVTLEANVGNWVFDIFTTMKELPKAPYYRSLEKNKRARLAEDFASNDTLDLTEDVETALRDALKEDDKWDKIKLSVSFKVGDEMRYDLLSSGAIELFGKLQEEILKVCNG
jgi:hypothetical protein